MCGNAIVIILLLFTIFLFVYVCHIYVRMRVLCPGQTCLVWRSELVSGCLPQILFILFLREGLSLNLELAVSARLTGQGASRTCLSTFPLTSAGLIGTCCPTQSFHIGSRAINSGSRALGMSTLPTEPPPKPLCTIKAS